MSSETALATRRPAALPAVRNEQDFAGLVEMGDHLVRTGFLPEHIKNGVQAAAIIMAGRELAMPTMRSLRSLVMVKGKVQEFADSQLSRFKTDGGRAVFRELTTERAVLWMRHPNGDEHEELFEMADAKRAGIANHMYEKHPKPMLRSRAITAGLKSIGWEGGAGIYDPSEDLEDDIPKPATLPPRDAITEALRIPGAKTAFGGYGGQPLTECPSSLLQSFVEYVRKDEDRTRRYALHASAAEEIVLRRAAEEADTPDTTTEEAA